MRKLLLFVLLSMPAFGQTWSGILSSTRAIDWSHAGLPATLPDGETTATPWTTPTANRASCGTVSTVTSLTTAINTCHTNHPNGGVLTLTAGTYSTSTNIQFLPAANNVTLKGQGASNTKITFTGTAQLQMGLGSSTAGGSIGAKFTSNLTAGTSTATINSVTGSPMFGVGNLVNIIECNTGQSGTPNPSGGGCTGTQTDNGTIFFCGNVTSCNIDGAGTNSSMGQTVLVTSLTNLGGGSWSVTFSPSIYLPSLTTAQSVGMFWNDPTYSPVGVGLEDMTIETAAANSSGGVFVVTSCYACFVKGVRFVGKGVSGSTIANIGSPAAGGPKNFLFANNYLFAENPAALSSDNTLAIEQGADGDNLFLNNIIEFGFYEGQGSNAGIVNAYNYILNSQGSASTFYQASEFQHHPGSTFMLMEGNQLGTIREDNTWGTHNLNTFFRNYSSCYDPPFTGGNGGQSGLQFDAYARFENAIGNIIGDGNAAGCTSFSSNAGGSAFEINFGGGITSDSLVATTLMRWGNVTLFAQGTDTPANSGIRFVSSEVPSSLGSPNVALSNPVPGNTNLPASFFMSTTAHPSGGTGLSWWKVCTSWTSFPSTCAAYTTQPFPVSGPDVSNGPYVAGHGYDIPAALAWKNLPVDTGYQNSYTVTGSSWSGGLETLTVTGLPGGPHVMGGFTPPAWNSACNPVAGSPSYTGRSDKEILITNSNGTSNIVYALGSSPGVACTGTIKWPDVRQFDGAVFQSDSTAALTYSPNPLTFNPQPISTTSSGQTVTITNTSGGTITLTSEVLQTGTNYSISSNTCGGSLTAFAACVVTITFTPLSTNTLTDALVVTSSDVSSPVSVALSGIGLATPVINPGTGSYSGAQTTTITDTTTGTSIYYTLDGTAPDNTKTLYSGSFLVSTTTTVRAVAYLSGVASGSTTSVITITGTNNNLTTTVNHVVINHAVIN